MLDDKYIYNKKDITLKQGKVTWKSPSNIALVKYWGKKETQIPINPSISFTLKNSYTQTTLKYKQSENHKFKVYVENKREKKFEPKIKTFFERITKYVPFINKLEIEIHTKNTFPHSSGIASSASGFSALAMCIMSIEKELDKNITYNYFKEKASFLSRLGSGSACRSIYPKLVVWGNNKYFDNSSDLFAVPFTKSHKVFEDFQDTILLVDKGEKSVSSTMGHSLMNNHIFSEQRIIQANENIIKLKKALEEGNLKDFTKIVESEALTLHSMMMTSDPYFILMKSNTLKIIEDVWKYREEHKLNLTITLDAGANVHLLYPKKETNLAMELIKNTLVRYCKEGDYICDEVGEGCKQILT